ncbi:hypothetical protein GPALN_010655, partial [Globodera pallida]
MALQLLIMFALFCPRISFSQSFGKGVGGVLIGLIGGIAVYLIFFTQPPPPSAIGGGCHAIQKTQLDEMGYACMSTSWERSGTMCRTEKKGSVRAPRNKVASVEVEERDEGEEFVTPNSAKRPFSASNCTALAEESSVNDDESGPSSSKKECLDSYVK